MDTIERLNRFYAEKLSVEEAREALEQYNTKIDGFVIYGCGLLGSYLKDVMQELELNLLGYVDDTYTESDYKGVKMYSLKEVADFDKVSIILTPHNKFHKKAMSDKVYNAFSEAGKSQLDYDILDQNVLLYITHGYSLDKDKKQFGNVFEEIELVVTNFCTLRCRDCSQLIPYVKGQHFELSMVEKDVSVMNDLVDYIGVLEIMGGETLLYPELSELLDYITGLPNIYQLTIDTNGTVMPDEKVFDAIARNHVLLHVTDYGKKSTKKNQIVEMAEKKKIHYMMEKVGEWENRGEIREYESEDNDDKFADCMAAVECSNIYKGRWHICPRDTKQVDMELFSPREGEYIDLHEHTGEYDLDKKRQQLYELSHRKKAIMSCRYCKGTYEKVQGGIQINNVKKDI